MSTRLDEDFKPGLTVEAYRDIAARKLKEAEAAEDRARQDRVLARMNLENLRERLKQTPSEPMSQHLLEYNRRVTQADKAWESAKERVGHWSYALSVFTKHLKDARPLAT